MAKIIVTLDGKVLHELAVGHDRISIGRRPSNDIVLEDLVEKKEPGVLPSSEA